MPIITFIPFVLFPFVRHWEAPQAVVAAIILFIILFKNEINIKLMHLPYILFPVFCFANLNVKMEFFSENAIWLFCQFAVFLLIFSGEFKINKSWLVAPFIWLLIQFISMIIGVTPLDLFSVFPRENAYHFVNMIMLFVCVAVRGKFACVVAVMLLFSIFIGDTFRTGKFALSPDDSVNIWLGLFAGILLTSFFILLRKLKISPIFAAIFSALFMFLWEVTPVLVAYMDFWQMGMNSSATTRITFWRTALNMFAEHLFLGVGGGSFGALFFDYYSANSIFDVPISITTPHNEAMAVLVENGIIGLVWQSFLFGFPLVYFSWYYILSGSKKSLFFLFGLFTILSTVQISEAPRLFVSSFLAMWIFLAFAVKEISRNPNFKSYRIKRIFMLILIPMLLVLIYDRGMQIYSQTLTYKFEQKGAVLAPQDAPIVFDALKISPKNAAALWNLADMHILDKNYENALLSLDALEEISGTIWPIHYSRFLIYSQMGDTLKACAQAQKTLPKRTESDAFRREHCK